MNKKDNDYSFYLAIIAILMAIGSLAQCGSVMYLDGIRQELSRIKHELNLTRYE